MDRRQPRARTSTSAAQQLTKFAEGCRRALAEVLRPGVQPNPNHEVAPWALNRDIASHVAILAAHRLTANGRAHKSVEISTGVGREVRHCPPACGGKPGLRLCL